MGMPALRMRHRQPAHPFRQVAVPARPDDQVPMIGQQTIRQEPHGQPVEGRAQDAFKGGIVFWLVEDSGPVNRSVEDMVDESTGSDTQAPWHALKLTAAGAGQEKRLPTPFLPPKRKDSRPLFFPREKTPDPFSSPPFLPLPNDAVDD